MVFFKDVDVTVIRFASLVEIACPSISTYQQGSISKSAVKIPAYLALINKSAFLSLARRMISRNVL